MADVTIDGAISTASARGQRSVVFTTTLIGYWFYIDGDGVFGYSKTTDGGATWGAQVDVDGAGATTVIAYDIWFDQWTPNDSGTLIHCWWFDSTNNTVRWRTLQTSSDTLGTVRTVFGGASAVAGRGSFVSGTKTKSGYLYCAYDIDAGAEKGLHRSTDSGTTWSASLSATFIEATLDTCKLFPDGTSADPNDCWAVYYDSSANQLTLKQWDSSAAAQVESVGVGTAMTDGATDLTGQWGYDGAIRFSDGHLMLTMFSLRDSASANHQVYDVTSTSTFGSVTGSLSVNIDDRYYPAMFIDQATGNLYVAYNGKRDGSENLDTATKVYYAKWNGASWSSGDTAYMEGAAGVVQQVWSTPMGPRFYVGWRVGTTLVGNKVNSVAFPTAQAVAGATRASAAALNVPSVAWDLPFPTAYWPFDENTGGFAADRGSLGTHTATLQQSTWDTTLKKFGPSAITRVGTTGRHASFTSYNIGTNHTIACWINGYPGSGNGIILGGLNEHEAMYLDATILAYATPGGFFTTVAHGGITGSHHLAVVRSGTKVNFYKDGVLLAGAADLADGTNALVVTSIGGWEESDDQIPPLTIDDLRIYTSAFTAAQVAALALLQPAFGATLASGATLTAPTVANTKLVTATTIASGATLTPPTVAYGLVGATRAAAATLTAPTVAYSVLSASIAPSATLTPPTVASGTLAATIPTTATLTPPAVAVAVLGATLASSATLTAPTVVQDAEVAGATLASGATLAAPTVVIDQAVLGATIGGGLATYTVRDVQQAAGLQSAGLAAPVFAVPVAVGDLIVVAFATWAGSGAHDPPTDSTGANTYVQLAATETYALNHVSLWACVAPVADGAVVVTGHQPEANIYSAIVAWLVRPSAPASLTGDAASSHETTTDPTTAPAPPGLAFFLAAATTGQPSFSLTPGAGWNALADGFDATMAAAALYGDQSANVALYTEYRIASGALTADWVDADGGHGRSVVVASFVAVGGGEGGAVLFAATVTTDAVEVEAATIASDAALFAATVVVPDVVEVEAATIGSDATLFAATVTPDGVLAMATVPSGATLFAATVTPDAVLVEGATIASGATLEAPTLEAVSPGLDLETPTIASTASLTPPVVTVDAVDLTGATIASGVTLAAPTLASVIAGATIGSDATLAAPTLATVVAAATLASGATLTPPVVEADGDKTVAGATVASTATLGAPAVVNELVIEPPQLGVSGPRRQPRPRPQPPVAQRVRGAHLGSHARIGPPTVTEQPAPTVGGVAIPSTADCTPPALVVSVYDIGAATVTHAAVLMAPTVTAPAAIVALSAPQTTADRRTAPQNLTRPDTRALRHALACAQAAAVPPAPLVIRQRRRRSTPPSAEVAPSADRLAAIDDEWVVHHV